MKHEVEVAITGLALLHLSLSRTLVEELGERKDRELITRSIIEHGKRVGERIEQGLQSLPKYVVYEGSKDGKIYGCILAKAFRECGEEDLGSLYCYVDPAQTMAVNLGTILCTQNAALLAMSTVIFSWFLQQRTNRGLLKMGTIQIGRR